MAAPTPPVADDHRKQAFINWLCTPPHERQPSNMEELAKLLGVHAKTLGNWKKDEEFRRAWQERATEIIGDPDRQKEIMDALFLVAKNPTHKNHVPAAKLYLEAIDAIKPKKVEVAVTSQQASKLTDEELDALIAMGAAELKAERGGG